jgi:hypothetical protein
MHPLLRYLLVATTLCLLLFLGLGGFFTGWDGHVVSRRPAASGVRALDTVLIVTADGKDTEVEWPADTVAALDLPIDARGTSPARLPKSAAPTHKSRFGFHFTVSTADGAIVAHTPVRRAAFVAVITWFALLVGANLVRSGSPLTFEPRAPTSAPPDAPPDASAPPTSRASKSRRGPPPRKPRRGVRR